MGKETTIIIFTGPHYPSQRHEINRADKSLTKSLIKMSARHHWPINVKEAM